MKVRTKKLVIIEYEENEAFAIKQILEDYMTLVEDKDNVFWNKAQLLVDSLNAAKV